MADVPVPVSVIVSPARVALAHGTSDETPEMVTPLARVTVMLLAAGPSVSTQSIATGATVGTATMSNVTGTSRWPRICSLSVPVMKRRVMVKRPGAWKFEWQYSRTVSGLEVPMTSAESHHGSASPGRVPTTKPSTLELVQDTRTSWETGLKSFWKFAQETELVLSVSVLLLPLSLSSPPPPPPPPQLANNEATRIRPARTLPETFKELTITPSDYCSIGFAVGRAHPTGRVVNGKPGMGPTTRYGIYDVTLAGSTS